jgi:hypothetical protein
MADNNQQLILNEFLKTLASARSIQGDYESVVDNSISSLKRLNRELEKQNEFIRKNVDEEFNYKKISEEILKAKQKESLAQKNVGDLSKYLSDQAKTNGQNLVDNINKKIKAEQLYHAAVRSNNQNQIKNANQLIDNLNTEIQLQERLLNTEELQYAASLKALETRSRSVKLLEEELKKESALSKIKRYAGMGASAAGAVGSGIGKAGSTLASGGANLYDDLTKLTSSIPIIGTVISGALTGIKSMLDFILEIEDRAVKFGRALGYSREESFKIAESFGNLSTSTGKLLVTTQNLMEVQTDLSNQLGVTNILSSEMLATQIELKKIMGLSADEMGSLAQASIISGKGQKETVEGIVGQVAGLKQATGISFNYKQIIGEVSKLSGVLGLQFAKYPQTLAKSAIVTKALGMDLAKVDQIAGSLLNFEESIQNQLEAQLITGKNINLSRAQQLALEGDTAGVAIEISKQFGTANEYLEMNRIQQESIAKAVGMTREDLADTLKNQEMLTKLGAKDTDNAQKRLQLAVARFSTEKEINEALGEGAYQNLTQLSAQEKIAALIDKVKGAFQDFLTKSGVVEWVTGLIQKLTDPKNVKGLINTLKEGVAFVADMIQGIAIGIVKIADIFTDIDPALIKRLEGTSAGDSIRSMGSGEANVKDFIIKPMNEDTITMAGGTKLGRTDEMVDVLRQILNETKQGKSVTVSVDGQPLAVAVARNASLTQAASNLGPRPLR